MRRILTPLILVMILAACGVPDEIAAPNDSCPITIPTGHFEPPDGFPLEWAGSDGDVPAAQVPLVEGGAWYGSDALWTVLPIDGDYTRRKSVWWSVEFPGGTVEERPPITVTWTRLDDPNTSPIVTAGGTNAYTPQDGWFMIAGIDPDEPGCWQVDASYKGATASYVYEG